MNKGKKALALFLTAVMAMSALSGCGDNGGSSAAGSSTPASSASTAAGDSNEPVTLTIGIKIDPLVEDYETNYFTQMMEEENNVNLEFFTFPSDKDGFKSKLSLMISSNTTLPDIIDTEDLGESEVAEYGSKGIFVPINEYLDNPELAKYFSQINDTDREFMYSTSKSPDGNIYGLTEYSPWPWNCGAFRMWYNQDWLTTLGLDVPSTTDEFYEVLKAEVNGNPNGNGINDEIGLVGAKDGWALDVIAFVMNAFVYTNPYKNYWVVENGKVSPAYTTDGWKQGLEFLHKLSDEGLLSPLSYTQDQTQLKALIQKEGGVAGFVPAGSYSTFAAGTALKFDEMQLLPPLTGPEGQCNVAYSADLPFQVWFITKDCKDVEKAFTLGNWFYSEKASMVSRFGEEGVDYFTDAEGCAKWESYGGADTPVTFYPDKTFWGSLQSKNWGDKNPRYRSVENMLKEGRLEISSIPAEGERWNAIPEFTPNFVKYYASKFPSEFISKLPYTTEETEAISVSSTDIQNHFKEMTTAFIMGTRSLDEWDNYITELNNMGLENYTAVAQAAYDRSK